MKKNNVLIVLVVLFVVLFVGILTTFIVTKKKDSNISAMTLDDVMYIDNQINQNSTAPTLDMFNKYVLKSKEKEGDMKSYIYDLNDKYEVEVRDVKGYVVNIILRNKASFNFVDIMYDSLEEFLKYD